MFQWLLDLSFRYFNAWQTSSRDSIHILMNNSYLHLFILLVNVTSSSAHLIIIWFFPLFVWFFLVSILLALFLFHKKWLPLDDSTLPFFILRKFSLSLLRFSSARVSVSQCFLLSLTFHFSKNSTPNSISSFLFYHHFMSDKSHKREGNFYSFRWFRRYPRII